MRKLFPALVLGLLMVSSGGHSAFAHDNNNNGRDHGHGRPPSHAQSDNRYAYRDKGDNDYQPRYYAPPPAPIWITPVRYGFAPHESYVVADWFRWHPSYNVQRVQLPYAAHINLRPVYGPVYQAYALPVELTRKLPPLGYGLQRILVNNQILLMDMRTGQVHDVIYL